MGWGLGLVLFELRSKWCKGLERKPCRLGAEAQAPPEAGGSWWAPRSQFPQRAARGPGVSLSSGAQKPICSEVKAKLASWRSGAGALNPKRKKEMRWSTGSTKAEEIRTLRGLKPSAPAVISQVRHSMLKTLNSLNAVALGSRISFCNRQSPNTKLDSFLYYCPKAAKQTFQAQRRHSTILNTWLPSLVWGGRSSDHYFSGKGSEKNRVENNVRQRNRINFSHSCLIVQKVVTWSHLGARG